MPTLEEQAAGAEAPPQEAPQPEQLGPNATKSRQGLAYQSGDRAYNDMGTEIMNEAVKSYGFKRDRETGEWDWSADNIKQAFKTDPVWTTIDYLTLAVPVAKWGTAARAVSEGGSIAARSFEAAAIGSRAAMGAVAGGAAAHKYIEGDDNDIGGATVVGAGIGAVAGGLLGVRSIETSAKWVKRARDAGEFAEGYQGASRFGRFMNESGHGEFAAAVAKQAEQPGTGRIAQAFTNFGARYTSEEDKALIAKYGFDPKTLAVDPGMDEHVLGALQNGKNAQNAYYAAIEGKILGNLKAAKMDVDTSERWAKSLETGVKPEEAGFEGAAHEAYKQTWDLRQRIHDEALNMGMISPETYVRNLDRYLPRQYQELKELSARAGAEMVAGQDASVRQVAGGPRFKPRSLPDPTEPNPGIFMQENQSLTQILDPSMGVLGVVNAAFKLSQVKYIRGIAQSPLVKDSGTILERLGGSEYMGKLRALIAGGDESLIAEHLKEVFPESAAENATRAVKSKDLGEIVANQAQEQWLHDQGWIPFL